jgi:uncharacterized membrane protein YkvA (DUF1232 family)
MGLYMGIAALERWKQRARNLKLEAFAIYMAYRDPRVPWHAKLFAALVVAYIFSPIDFIPDFIPVLGYLDELVLVPLCVYIVLKMIPPGVMEECRQKAQATMSQGRPTNWIGAVIIIVVWVLMAALGIYLMAQFFFCKRH